MAKNPPDERLVYLALKNVFKGVDAQLRDPKKIRKQIQKHEAQGEVRALIDEHDLVNVCTTARVLLKQDIFASTLRAKIEFPEVFEVSPAQSADRVVSEEEAARSEADAIRDVALGCQPALPPAIANDPNVNPKGKAKQIDTQVPTSGAQKQSTSYAKASAPSLYPLYLPLRSQHQLLAKVQAILEDAAYTFGLGRMGELLQQNGWDSPECVELNLWTRSFLHDPDLFDASKIDELRKPFPEFLTSIAQIRHTAVHRVPVTANRIEQFMIEAESFADLLSNDSCVQILARLRRQAQIVTEEFGRNKDLLEATLTEKLKDIAIRRAELDRLERVAVEDTLREDKEYQALAGANLEQAVNEPKTILHRVECSEQETGSEADIDADSVGEPSFSRVVGDPCSSGSTWSTH